MKRLLIACASVLLTASGVVAQDGPPRPAAKGAVVLEASVREVGGEQVLHLKVTNGTKQPIYLFTPIRTFDPQTKKREPDPKRVYVSWSSPGALELSKRVWPEPKNVLVNEPEVPLLTRLEAGAEHVEEIPLASPLPVDFPYMHVGVRRAKTAHTSEARTVTVRLGYLKEGTKGLKKARGGLYSIPYGLGSLHQQVVERPVEARLKVIERPVVTPGRTR